MHIFGFGTLLNVAAIVLGGVIGLLGGRLIADRYRQTLMTAMGVCVLFIGLAGALQQLLAVVDGQLTVSGTMMMIGSFAVGSVLGELLNLEDKLERFGAWLKRKTGAQGDAGFVNGFVTASLTVCIGAMAVVGSLRDGLDGDYSILAAKAVLDLVIVMILTASMGRGCIFSALPVGIFQGVITVSAKLLSPVLTDGAMANLSLTGSVLIFCVGANLIWDKHLRVANMLPTLVVAVVWALAEAAL